MADDKYTFEQARIRLEEIAAEVRKKDTSLEKSLDLLEEGVRLANICTELVDHTDVSASVAVPVPESDASEIEAAASEPEDAGESSGLPEADAERADSGDDVSLDAPDGEGFDDAEDDVDEPADSGAVD